MNRTTRFHDKDLGVFNLQTDDCLTCITWLECVVRLPALKPGFEYPLEPLGCWAFTDSENGCASLSWKGWELSFSIFFEKSLSSQEQTTSKCCMITRAGKSGKQQMRIHIPAARNQL